MRLMKASVAGFLALAGASVLACSDSPSERVTGPAAASNLSLDRSTVDQKAVVTGGVSFLLPEGPEVMTRTSYAFSAIREHDGDVKGELEILVERDPNQVFHARVECMGVAGNKANIGARVTKSSVSFVPAGSYLAWSVADNGEGRKSPPDLTSNFFLVDQHLAMAHCANGGINPPMFPVQKGDIQVHTGHDND